MGRKRYSSIVFTVAVLFAWIPGESRAAVSPCGTASAHFDGAGTTFQTTIFGARANIEVRQPALCGTSSVSVIWAMVTADSAIHSGGSGWAQTGSGNFGSTAGYSHNGYLEFAQYTKWCDTTSCATGYPITRFGDVPPLSGSPEASAFEKQTDSNIHMYYQNTQIAVTDFSLSSAWDPAWSAQFSGETHHLGSDIVGVQANHVSVTNLQKATDTSSDWANVTSTAVVSGDCRFRYQSVGTGTDFDVWTQPLDSLTC